MTSEATDAAINPEQLALISKQLADIEMPTEPDWMPVYLVIGVLFLITLLATALQLHHRRRQLGPGKATNTAQQYALSRLAELEASWRSEQCDPQTLGFRLATTLRMGLKLNRLTPEPPATLALNEKDRKEWQQLYQHLYRLRYQATADTQLIDQALFDQVRHYINLAPPSASC